MYFVVRNIPRDSLKRFSSRLEEVAAKSDVVR
jgi:hypothetical protein